MDGASHKSPSQQKVLLRKQFLALRKQISGAARRTAEQSIVQRVLSVLHEISASVEKSHNLGLYTPFRGEVDISPLFDLCGQYGWTACVPKTDVESKRMDFYAIPESPEWVSGAYGIQELNVDLHTQPIPSEHISAVIVPGLAFTPEGWRLGYGGGYYDRLFARLPNHVVKIGCGFAAQLTGGLPVLRLDVKMDYVVTEAGVIRCKESH